MSFAIWERKLRFRFYKQIHGSLVSVCYLVAEDEGEENEEVGVGDLQPTLGGGKHEDDVAEEDSGQE